MDIFEAVAGHADDCVTEGLAYAAGRTRLGFAGKMNPAGAGSQRQRSRFRCGNIHQQLGTAAVDLRRDFPGQRQERGRIEVFLPQLDEMHARC